MTDYSNLSLPETLTPLQEQTLIGTLLGDAYLELSGNYARMKIDRQAQDRPYLEWQYDIFKDFCKSGIADRDRYDERYDKTYKQVSFRTRSVPALLPYHQKWYGSGVKKVPNDLELAPIILATWFSDDGCIINHGRNRLTLKIATDGFGHDGAKFLSDKLENLFDRPFPIYQKKKGRDLWFIKASTLSAQPFIKYIDPVMRINGMQRKVDTWKSVDLGCVPLNERSTVDHSDIYRLILDNPDFSINDAVSSIKSYSDHSLRDRLNQWYGRGYLDRYDGKEKFNPYHYRMTPIGKEFFEKQISDQ